MELYDRICRYTLESGIAALLLRSHKVVCAYSGGADSTVLLHFLMRFAAENGIEVIAAHMNHMMRGAESDRDEQFCRDFCREHGVEIVVQRADIPAICAEKKLGSEECARNERYRFLAEVSKENGGCPVATAHNATDNLETVIFSLARGTGANGLCGIPPVRDKLFVRPLLCCTSEEIRSLAAENRWNFVFDSTNADTDITRNFVRTNIVPSLRRLNPAAERAAMRMSAILRDDCDFIGSAAVKLCSGTVLPREAARGAHRAVLARAVTNMYRGCTGASTDLSAASVADCVSLILSTHGGSVSLPFGAVLRVECDSVFIEKSEDEKKPEKPEEIELCAGKTLRFGKYYVKACENEADIPSQDENIYNLSIHTAVRFDKIYGKLFVRSRLGGDTLYQNGMHKSLKKLMSASRVPERLRDTLPLFCDDCGIVWVPSVGLRDNAAALSGKQILLCVYESAER